MRIKYKVLVKCPVLLPVMWVVRGFEVLIFRRRALKLKSEAWKNIEDKTITDYQQRFKLVGLDIDKSE